MRSTRSALRTTSILLCAVASLCSAGNLAFLHDGALVFLDDQDRKLQQDAAREVLENTAPKSSKEWSNPKSGSHGRVESLGDLKSEDGLHCRDIRLYCKAKGAESQFAFPVCRDRNGEWFIASGKKLEKV